MGRTRPSGIGCLPSAAMWRATWIGFVTPAGTHTASSR